MIRQIAQSTVWRGNLGRMRKRQFKYKPEPERTPALIVLSFSVGNSIVANSYFPGDTVPISRAFVDAAYLHCEVPVCVLDWFLQLPRKSLTVFFFAEL